MLFILSAIVGMFGIFELPKLIINPEWYAFKNIMSQLSQLK